MNVWLEMNAIVVANIRAALAEPNMTVAKLSRRINRPSSWLGRKLHQPGGVLTPCPSLVQEIAEALDCPQSQRLDGITTVPGGAK